MTAGIIMYLLAQNLYRKNLDDKILLFNPDADGNPVLVRKDLGNLLDTCSQGASKEKILSLAPSSLSEKNKESLFDFLKKSHVIESPGNSTSSESFPCPHERGINIWFHITNDCNLRCPYCFVKKTKDSMTKNRIDTFVSSLLDGMPLHGYKNVVIKFAGGEPLLRRDLMEYAVHAMEQKNGGALHVSYAVISNGTQLNEETISFLKEHKMGLSISLDGYGDIHDKTRRDIHGNGSFEVIEKNIQLLKKKGIRPFMLGTISEETIAYLPRLTRWLLDNELYSRYSFVKAFDRPRSAYQAFCEKIIVAMEQSAKEIMGHRFGPRFVLNWAIAELSFDSPIWRQPCGIGTSHLVVNHRGELALCPMMLDRHIGTVDRDIFEQYRQHESRYEQTTPQDRCCQKCRWYRVCGTGCPILNESLSGHPNKRSPFCSADRRLIPMYIDLYGWALQKLSRPEGQCKTKKPCEN